MQEFSLVGISLPHKTTNENGQSSIDGGNLWQKFEKESYIDRIPNRSSDDIYAVYYDYEGDHSKPFRYFIGCKVNEVSEVPKGMQALTIPSGQFTKLTASGKMPDCMINTWREIWDSTIKRSYNMDFEIYDERSHNWENAEIDIYLS